MIVCLCTGVPESTVRTMVARGTRTVEALSAACGAGSSCGACFPMLEDLLAEAREGSGFAETEHVAA